MQLALDTLQDRVERSVMPVLEGGPCFVVDIAVRGSKGSHAVDVFVESDGVLDARTIAQVSREIGYVLETDDVMPGPYTLHVSSPGADRPLKLPRQYQKMVGRDLRVHFAASGKNSEVVGPLLEAGDEGIVVQANGTPHAIQFSDILWAKVKLPW